jgi:hypothetical protein
MSTVFQEEMEQSSSIIITPPSSTSIPSSSSSRAILTRRMTSSESRISSNVMLDDCPICLNEMHQTDYDHLLQCEHHCGFNMCKSCIESLLASSKDDFQEASDGNRHVKVYLHCPNCRSDLSHTIRDTLVLRKADEILHSEVDPSEWTASQIRMEKAMQTPAVQQAIKEARKLEAEYYYGDEFESNEFVTFDEEDEQFIEEWGVEADCIQGVHDSFRAPPPPEQLSSDEMVRIDPTLFAGLDFALTEEQRLEVTEYMTSGDPALLVEAANILHKVAQDLTDSSRRQHSPTEPVTTTEKSLTNRNVRKSLARRSSVFQLIAEAQVAHGADKEDEKKVNETCSAALSRATPRSRVAQHRNFERELRLQADFQKCFPLPVRMPKAIELDLDLPFDIELVDYTWGGKGQWYCLQKSIRHHGL